MKNIFKTLIFFLFTVSAGFIIEQKEFDPNRTSTFIINTGLIDQDLRSANHPGFQWPAGSEKYAIFSAGLSVMAYINNELRSAICFYRGELAPGYIIDSSGIPVGKTDSRFKIYRVKKGDNHISNPDWYNWGNLEQFGAPYIDVNNNHHYEYLIDTPGVRGASQTVFCCLTDAFPESHDEIDFGGGTLPVFAEYHVTAWGYDSPGLQDFHYIKWQVINKNNQSWDSTYFSILCDPDLGEAGDDYIGCDSIRNMGYCYNGDSLDEGPSYSYGLNPPAVGIKYIRGAKLNGSNLGMTSFLYLWKAPWFGNTCEYEYVGNPLEMYKYMTGIHKDGSPCIVPNTNPPIITKKCYSGDPETHTGWTEFEGCVVNCGNNQGYHFPNPPLDKKFCMGSGSKTLKINPNDTQTIVIAQLIARGTSNLNSVTKLKQLSDIAQTFYDSGYVIGVNNVSTEIPRQYNLYQNYPNPFNPSTIIKFEIPNSHFEGGKGDVKLVIYDIQGKSVETLIDKELKAGSYSADWNASNYASGVYFYSLMIDNKLFETKKMILIK
jgi:hypothetical protein